MKNSYILIIILGIIFYFYIQKCNTPFLQSRIVENLDEHCTLEGKDPYNKNESPYLKKYSKDERKKVAKCCHGLKKVLKNWNNDNNYFYKCLNDEGDININNIISTKSNIAPLLIIRHAKDDNKKREKNNKLNNDPNYKRLPNGQMIPVYSKGLTSEGKAQAENLVYSIPSLLNKYRLPKITKVITQKPFEGSIKNHSCCSTPNPFDTALPFIKANNIQNVQLVDSIPNLDDLKNNGTVLFVGSRQSIRGENKEWQNKTKPENNTILNKLSKDKNKKYIYPSKAKTVYVYKDGKIIEDEV